MPTQEKPFLTPIQDADERRRLVLAGRELIKHKLSYVAPQHGISTQNFYVWLKGLSSVMSEERQKSAMAMYGITPSGQLVDSALHAWTVPSKETATAMDTLLTYEQGIIDVHVIPAYSNVRGRRRDPNEILRCFIGLCVRWLLPAPNGKQLQRRLIITLPNNNDWGEDPFIQCVRETFASRVAPGQSVEFEEPIDVVQATAEEIWQWHYKNREANGARVTSAPKKGLLPFDQDIIGKVKPARESAFSVLEDMAPRFKRIADTLAQKCSTQVSAHDLAIVRRANSVLKVGDKPADSE